MPFKLSIDHNGKTSFHCDRGRGQHVCKFTISIACLGYCSHRTSLATIRASQSEARAVGGDNCLPCLPPAVIYTMKIQAATCGKHQCCRGWSKSTANAQDASTTITSNVHLIGPSRYGNSTMPLSHGGPQNALRINSGSSYFTQTNA